MFWGKGPDKPDPSKTEVEKAKESAKEVKDAVKEFDASKLPDRHALPKGLQKIIEESDKEDNFYDELVNG
jgi:mitochondrial fission process protein 1